MGLKGKSLFVKSVLKKSLVNGKKKTRGANSSLLLYVLITKIFKDFIKQCQHIDFN